MEKLELTTQENNILNKYGFCTRRNLSWKKHIETIIYINILSIYSIIPGFIITLLGLPVLSNLISIDSNFSFFSIVILVSGICILYPLFQYIAFFVQSGITFLIKDDRKIEYGRISKIEIHRPKIYMDGLIERLESSTELNVYIFFIATPIIISILFLITLYESGDFGTYNLISRFFYGYLSLITVTILIISLTRNIYQSIHPIYAFGNLGEKIQKLTPTIEEQSKQIQSEFQSDMNYSVLSSGFDSLSSTFSNIVTLVIKLEKMEARANKGNLFDSEKYINSLRSDIVTPLISLKTFLEKKKTELSQSQKELTRVQVGGKEETGNIELQSKRSESLIQELTENIEKLDVMVRKIGK